MSRSAPATKAAVEMAAPPMRLRSIRHRYHCGPEFANYIIATFCDIAKPLRLSTASVDALTDAEVNAVLTHNETVGWLCAVKP